MAIVVEDGTAKADAETYISVADADTYHSNRANTAWAALSTPNKEAALRKAADYMLQVYRLRWKGSRVTGTQALDWPRNFVVRDDFESSTLNGAQIIGGRQYYPSDEVPVEIQRATAELALKSSSADLAPDISQRVTREKVDVLEVQYAEHGVQYAQYRAVDNLLAPFLMDAGSTMRRVVRT